MNRFVDKGYCFMDNLLGQYLLSLLDKNHISQAELAREIRVSRQLLSYIICGKREMSLSLAMKLESFFSLSDGELLKMQALLTIRNRKRSIREHLCKQLIAQNAFWSYNVDSNESIPDEELIEKCFTVLDMDDIDLMFEIFPRKRILQVWRERMAIQGEYMEMLNIMIATYYFGIKNPEQYLAKMERQHINKISSSYATGINI